MSIDAKSGIEYPDNERYSDHLVLPLDIEGRKIDDDQRRFDLAAERPRAASLESDGGMR